MTNNLKVLTYLSFLLSFLMSCSISPKDINYGKDGCVYCKMTIVDQRYGTELVTTKGKVHMFDAIECLINYMNENKLTEDQFKHILATGFNEPGKLIDATSCFYLQSKNLPSPMGMFLTAFASRQEATEKTKEVSGEVYDWQELNDHFEQLKP